MLFLITFFLSAVVIFLMAYFAPGLAILQLEGLFVYSVFIGLTSTLARPLIRVVMPPVTVLKFVLLTLVFNTLALYFGDLLIYGIEIYTVFAFLATLLILTAINLLVFLFARRFRRHTVEALSKDNNDRRQEVFLLLETLVGIAIAVVISLIITPKATISGHVVYNGVMPANAQDFSIAIVQKQYRSGDKYEPVQTNIPLDVNNEWDWEEAEEGVTYQIQAITLNGDYVAVASNIIEVTAPASKQVLVFNVTSEQLEATQEAAEAAAMAEGSPTTTTQTTSENTVEIDPVDPLTPSAIVSGTLDLNGYIPDDAKVTIYRKASHEADFAVTREVEATDGLYLEWDQAVAGEAYASYGVLHAKDGTEIGRSQTGTIIAPSLDNVLTINSTAEPPQPAEVAVSGTIELIGGAPLNSTIQMLQRKHGDSEYQEFAVVDAVDGTVWQYNNAEAAAEYDITAILKVGSANYREGTVVTVVAPASGEVITIDSSIPEPSSYCGVNYTIRNDWGTGTTVDILVRNDTTSVINNWTLEWTFPGNQTIDTMWNATSSQSGRDVTATSSLPIPANGGTVQIGFNASYKGANKKPTSFTLNDQACELY